MKNISLVIAEDDKKNAELQRRFVERIDGVDVVGIAHQLDDARELLEVFKPELLLLDIHFPGGSGLHLLREIRSANQATDVILITAAKEVGAIQEALRGGVFDYILKPLMFDRLNEAIQRYRQHLQQLNKLGRVQQEDVDTLLPRSIPAHSSRLPKGIDALTLTKVEKIFDQSLDLSLNAEDVGGMVGVSRTTARRYLEYLASINVLFADVEYGSVGRPERLYSSAK